MQFTDYNLIQLNFLTKILHSKDCLIKDKVTLIQNSYEQNSYEQIHLCSNDIAIRNTNINFNIVQNNFTEAYEALKLLKDDSLIKQFIDICKKIFICETINDKKQIDNFIYINCEIYGKSKYNSSYYQLDEIKQLIIDTKLIYLKNLKEQLIRSKLMELLLINK